MKISLRFAVLALLESAFLAASLGAQTTIHVPADQPTIQAGINAANNGDTVLVAAGVYQENIDFKGKNITVTSGATSSAAAANTVILAPNPGPAVTLQSGEGPAATLNGFTISHAPSGSLTVLGDGIEVNAASPTITNNVISSNTGCGVMVYDAQTLLFQGNIITGTYPIPTSVPSNTCNTPDKTISSQVIFGVSHSGTVRVLNNQVTGNYILAAFSVEPGAGAIVVDTATNLIFQGNLVAATPHSIGGLEIVNVPNISIVQNLVVAMGGGGNGISINNAYAPKSSVLTLLTQSLIITNNTIYSDGNASSASYSDYGVTLEILATMVYANISNNIFATAGYFQATSCDPLELTYEPPNASLTFSHNDSYSAVYSPQTSACESAPFQSTGNISADPQFVNAANGDFHTNPASPVVAAGDITAPLIPPADFDGKAREVCGTIDMGAYEVHPSPPIALTGTPNPVVGGNTVDFAAQLTGNCNVPTGTLSFFDSASLLATEPLNATAFASYSTASLIVGTHPITATYPGDFNFSASTSNTVQEVVTGHPSSAVLAVSPATSYAGSPVTLSVQVSSTSPAATFTPSGTITFLDGGTVLGSATLSANATASLVTSSLPNGNSNVTCTYSGDVHYAGSSCNVVPVTVTVAPTGLALSSNNNPAAALTPVTYTLHLSANGQPAGAGNAILLTYAPGQTTTLTTDASGAATYTVTNYTPGSYAVTASFAATSNLQAATAALTEVVVSTATTTGLSVTPDPAYQGQTVTLTATVTTGNGLTPVGSVTFTDGATPIGAVAVGTGGQAILTTSTLSLGSHLLTAAYSGSLTGFGTSTSNTVQETVLPSTFAISLSPSSLTVARGQSSSTAVQLSSMGIFAGPLALSYGAVPVYATASIGTPNVTLTAGGTATTTLNISTLSLATNAPSHLPGRPRELVYLAVLLVLVPIRRRHRPQVSTRLIAILTWLLAMQTLNGCTNQWRSANTVSPGTYQIPVTATSSGQGPQTVTLTLTVTP